MAENNLEKTGAAEIIAKLVLEGDLSKLSAAQKVQYYKMYCDQLGLNPLTRPFQIIKFEGKEVMYPTKDCTEQLRKLHEVSVVEVLSQELKGLLIVTVKVMDKGGKTDVSTGAVSLKKDEKIWVKDATKQAGGYYKKTGKKIDIEDEELANALMKAETKAKRRATLSICGLGSLEDPGEGNFLNEPINPDEVVVTHETVDNPEPGDFVNKEAREKAASMFEGLGILKGDLEEKLGKKLHMLTKTDQEALAAIYGQIYKDPKTALAKFRELPLHPEEKKPETVTVEVKEVKKEEEKKTTAENKNTPDI